MLNFGFSQYAKKTLYKKNKVIDQRIVTDMMKQKVDIIAKEDIHYLEYRGDQDKIKTQIKYNDLSLPIDKNKAIGELSILKNDIEVGRYAQIGRAHV